MPIFGVGERSLERWRREGAPGRTSRGWSVSAWIKWREARDGRAGKEASEQSDLTDQSGIAEDRAIRLPPKVRREEAEARIKELKVAQLERRLVLLDSVIRCMSKYITNCRQILISLQNSIPILIPEGEHRSLIRSETERQIANALEELAECGKELETMRHD